VIKYNLKCKNNHEFESWFSDSNEFDNLNFWKLDDESNGDQLKTVIGICLMLGSLFLMGLYSNLF